MPALTFHTRLLQVLPAGSPAYTHIYRLCTSGTAQQQQTMQAQPAAGNAGVAATSSARTSPASLDLGLNFATMDFDAVAKATQAAIARERGIGGPTLSSQREQEFEGKRERQGEQSAAQLATPPRMTSPTPQTSSSASFSASFHSNKTETAAVAAVAGRGFAGASTRSTTQSHRSNVSNTHNTLHEMLKGCLMEGNWAKAYQIFTNAVNQACRQVLIPSSNGGAAAAANHSSSLTNEQVDSARVSECLSALKKMLAALPPTSAQDRPVTSARRTNVRNLRGITRWTGPHYYLLWKCLLEAGRVEEVQHVWSVMQQIGFTEYQMEEKTVNTLMALLRRTSRTSEQAATQMIASAFPHTENFEERIESEKKIRRQIVKDLEQVATVRQFHLVGSNRRVVESIRIIEALHRVEQLGEGGKGNNVEEADVEPPMDAEESIIAVGDFNGLLRRSRSMESTQRVLRTMAKLNLEMESSTFASLIASLHNPQYVLEGHTAEELASHIPATSPTSQYGPTKSAEAETMVLVEDDVSDKAGAIIDTKAQYEVYKQKRVETALRWFFQCPQPRRNADVYNELLYLVRAKSHWRDFDRALVEFRGNAVVSEEEWPETTAVRSASAVQHSSVSEGQEADARTASRGASPCSPTPVAPLIILPPKWTTPPNGKTYELLIQRARYVHQWEIMWALYEEMAFSRVRGTTRLYEVLLAEAHRHPPHELHGVDVTGGGGGGADSSSEVLLRLYDELRRNGGDVRSFTNTMNVVNAWSKTRAKMNRWE